MKTSSRYILQISLAITFFTIGYMILQNPLAWGSLVSDWALKLMSGHLEATMKTTGYLDMILGVLFLFRPIAWISGLIGAIHLVVVLVTTGISSVPVTIRDVGLLGATIVILIETIPSKVMFWKR